MAVPLAIAGAGGGMAAFVVGVDSGTLVMAFAGGAMFSFVSRGTAVPVRLGLLMTAWVFGYYASMEIVSRQIFGFSSPRVPSFVAAFFCVVVFKALLAIFNEDGKAWIRKRLGLSNEGPKDD